MECPRRWTIVYVILYLSTKGTGVFCQNVAPGEAPGIGFRDSRSYGQELLNSILTVAASNGVLPDMIPVLQGQPYNQDVLAKPLSVVPMPTSGCVNSDPQIIPNQAARSPVPNQNVIYATPLPTGPSCSLNTISSIPQAISLPALPPSNCVPQIAQAVPLENYPMCAQNVGVARPMPIILQPQCQFNEVNPYNVYNQIGDPISLAEVNTQPLNLPILPPAQVLPTINSCSGNLDIAPNLGSPGLTQPTMLTSDGQPLPLNLQINVPSPGVPSPRITVVSANPPNIPVPAPGPYSSDPGNLLPFQYPPQPPVIIKGSSKSSLRNLLPILLVALCSDRGSNNGGGCCCCGCCCNCGNSGNNIPIPYPIPIPVNNPIINSCPYPYSSRNRECRDNGYDDDDKKRK